VTYTDQWDHVYNLADTATVGMKAELIEDFFKKCIDLSQFDRTRAIHRLAYKIKVPAGQLHALYKVVEARNKASYLMTTPGLVRPLSTDKAYPWGIAIDDVIVCKFESKDVAMKAVVCEEFMTLLVAEYGE